jgi:hypothetical protein
MSTNLYLMFLSSQHEKNIKQQEQRLIDFKLRYDVQVERYVYLQVDVVTRQHFQNSP